jgi:hypothetical protein
MELLHVRSFGAQARVRVCCVRADRDCAQVQPGVRQVCAICQTHSKHVATPASRRRVSTLSGTKDHRMSAEEA